MTSDAHAVRSADDPLANRGDIGIGYWQARKALADTFPIHPRLWEYPVTELREALSACADAFAAFVQHQHTAVCQGIKAIESQRDDARAALATPRPSGTGCCASSRKATRLWSATPKPAPLDG